jgi:hypothetical protein
MSNYQGDSGMKMTDHIRHRKSDYALVVQIITIVGAAYVIFAKPAEWDRAKEDMIRLKPEVANIEKRLTILETRWTDQNERIVSELISINRKLGR